MAEAALYNSQGEKIDEITLSDQLFDAGPNEALIHQALVRLRRVRRVGSVHTKGRSEIARTKAKWYRQKGTGHARHGARTAPLFVGGAKAHGPNGRRTWDGLPKRMRRQAIFAVMSDRRRHGRLTVVNSFDIEGYSTKRFLQILNNLDAFGKILIIVGPEEDTEERIYRSARNIPGVIVRVAPHLSLEDVLRAERLVLTQAALKKLEEVWMA